MYIGYDQDDQKGILGLGGIIGCYSCFAHVCFWGYLRMVLLWYRWLRVNYAYMMLMLETLPIMIMTYLLCSFTMSYVDLWLYDAYVGDYAITMLLSLMLMSYVD